MLQKSACRQWMWVSDHDGILGGRVESRGRQSPTAGRSRETLRHEAA